MPDEDLVDLLLDMKHELGKYLVMPVAMLPAAATDDQLRGAALRALTQTRPSQGGAPRSAARLWQDFAAEGGPGLKGLAGYPALESAVAGALAWQGPLQEVSGTDAEAARVDRAALLSDLRAVGDAIADLLAECGTGGGA